MEKEKTINEYLSDLIFKIKKQNYYDGSYLERNITVDKKGRVSFQGDPERIQRILKKVIVVV